MLSSFTTSQGENPKTKRIPLLVVDVRPEEHLRNEWRALKRVERIGGSLADRVFSLQSLRQITGR